MSLEAALGGGVLSLWGAERQNRQNYKIHQEKLAHSAQQNKLARRHDRNMLTRRQDFNSAQAQLARQFEKRMSNTKIRRRMRDMRKAGLNPILASQYATSGSTGVGAAQVSGGGSPGMTSPGGSPGMVNSIGEGVSSAMGFMDVKTRRILAENNTRQTEANINKVAQEISNLKSTQLLTHSEIEYVSEKILVAQQEVKLKIAQKRKAHADASIAEWKKIETKTINEFISKYPTAAIAKYLNIDGSTVASIFRSYFSKGTSITNNRSESFRNKNITIER